MAATTTRVHTLVVYGASARADAAVSALAGAARERGDRLTIVSLAAKEPESRQCCDTRSVLWNRVCSDLAREDLVRASRAADTTDSVEYEVLRFSGRTAADAVVREALACGANEIVLADPRVSGLVRLQRRRLRRLSPIPVSEPPLEQ